MTVFCAVVNSAPTFAILAASGLKVNQRISAMHHTLQKGLSLG